LKVASWGFIVSVIIGAAVGGSIILTGLIAPYGEATPLNTVPQTALLVISIILALAHAVFAILFGVGVDKVPVQSATKKTLRTLSILEGASLLSVVGLLVYPYLSFESYIFKLLFLRDTYKKEHTGKELRNKLWLFIPLGIYVLAGLFILLSIVLFFSAIFGMLGQGF
jgi:hypothetical protein